MALQSVPIGPFSSIFYGLTGQATALAPLTSVRTEGGILEEDLPTDYLVALDGPIQSANHTVRVNLTFLSDADETTRLVKGLNPAANINAPIGQTQYALMLVKADGTGGYYLPKVRTEKSYRRPYSKTQATTTGVAFVAENRDVTVSLMTQGTLAELQVAMGSQYPL